MDVSVVWIAVAGGIAVLGITLGVAAWRMWSHGDPQERTLVKRIVRLPLRDKLRLALALARESRIPLALRAVPAALVLYLATPVDVIPDFIPVIGHIDDLLIVIIGVGLLLRFTPHHVLEEHIARLEGHRVARP